MRENVDERWASLEKLEKFLKPSSKTFQESHLSAVKNIAEELFYFPTPEYPHYRTFVNEPEPEQRLFTNMGRELTPDIVVLEWPEKLPRMVAEVVTPDMIEDANATNWKVLSTLAGVSFFLYVPAGHASEVKALLKKHGIKGVALRTWRHITGLKTIDVAPVR
jgi:hypothetical protein